MFIVFIFFILLFSYFQYNLGRWILVSMYFLAWDGCICLKYVTMGNGNCLIAVDLLPTLFPLAAIEVRRS